MHVISENTLPIFLFHMIVIYTLQNGLLRLYVEWQYSEFDCWRSVDGCDNFGALSCGDCSTQKDTFREETYRLSPQIGNLG